MNVRCKNQFKFLLWLGIFMFSAAAVFAQQGTITGTITDANGDPIIGANVFIEGTTQGTVSDVNGKFILPNVPAGNVIIAVSFVGYLTETQTLSVTDGSSPVINVVLIEDLQQLTEVVVIGYGTQKKSDLTGAIASVDTEELEKLPNTGVSSMLQGMAAGVQVLQNSGQPGSEPVIRVRGLATVNGGSPLIVIDGISGGSLSDINPSDIASIEILKDAASQSIYGSAGGNGVILITTKKGQEGKLQVKFDMYAGIQQPWKKDVGIADAQEYAALYNTFQRTKELDEYFPSAGGVYLNPETNGALENTNWTDEIFRTALVQNYSLSLSGGTKFSKFHLGLNYNNEEGTVRRTSNDQYIIRLNSEHKILKRITLGENFNYISGNYYSQDEFNEYNSPLSTSIQMLPFIPVMTSDGSGNYAYRNAGLSCNIKNPMAQIEYNNNISKSQSISGNVFGRFEIIKGLTFESRFGMSYAPSEYRHFIPAHTIGTTENPSASQSISNNQYDYNVNLSNSWQWQNFFNYTFTLAKVHNFNLTAGYESGYYKYDYTNRQNYYSSDSLTFDPSNWENYSEADEMNIIQQKMTESTGYAYFFRLNYDYKGIVLLQGNFRRDYSSKFGPNNRIGNFPSISAGLKFSEIGFIKDLNIFNFGKIRVGYGETGNSDIQPFQYLATIGSVTMHGYPFNDIVQQGAALITASNPDLKWESVVTKNIGADFRFLNNRLGLSVDFFQRENQDMLLRKSVPLTVGYYVTDPGNELGDANIDTRPLVNYGTLNNKGFEISASFKNKVGDFSYEAYGNITRAITTIGDIGDPLYAGTGRGVSNVCRTVNDGPVSAFYGYVTDGVYQEEDFTWYYDTRWRRVVVNPNGTNTVDGTDAQGNPITLNTLSTTAVPGSPRYVDVSEDGEIGPDDMVEIGDPNPDFTYGFGFNFEYKNFNLNLFFQGSYGNDIFNLMKVNTYNIDNGGLNISSDLEDAFIPAIYDATNPNAEPTLLTPAENTNTGVKRMDYVLVPSDLFVEDGSYLRLKNIQIGYTFPVASLQKLKVQKLHVYIAATNLLTFTKYSGFDPEVNEAISSGQPNLLERGFDRGTYPQSRMYSIGVNLAF